MASSPACICVTSWPYCPTATIPKIIDSFYPEAFPKDHSGFRIRTARVTERPPPVSECRPGRGVVVLTVTKIGRPSTAEPFSDLVEKLLQEEPQIPSVEVLQRARWVRRRQERPLLHGDEPASSSCAAAYAI